MKSDHRTSAAHPQLHLDSCWASSLSSEGWSPETWTDERSDNERDAGEESLVTHAHLSAEAGRFLHVIFSHLQGLQDPRTYCKRRNDGLIPFETIVTHICSSDAAVYIRGVYPASRQTGCPLYRDLATRPPRDSVRWAARRTLHTHTSWWAQTVCVCVCNSCL